MTPGDRQIPQPESNPETEEFWQAATRGVFLLRHCLDCGRAHWYPRARCPFCFSARTAWRPGSGEGIIYSFSVMRRVPEPYVVAYVTLQEGPTMMTNLVDCDVAHLRIGQPVKMVFKACDGGGAVPMFTPA